MFQSLYIQDVLSSIFLPRPCTRLKGAETPMDHRTRLHNNWCAHMQLTFRQGYLERQGEVWS